MCLRRLDDVEMARGEQKKSVDIINDDSKELMPPDWNTVGSASIGVCFDGYNARSEHSFVHLQV